MEKNSKIYVAGHTGLVGKAIITKLQKLGFSNILIRNHNELDLKNQNETNEFLSKKNLIMFF